MTEAASARYQGWLIAAILMTAGVGLALRAEIAALRQSIEQLTTATGAAAGDPARGKYEGQPA